MTIKEALLAHRACPATFTPTLSEMTWKTRKEHMVTFECGFRYKFQEGDDFSHADRAHLAHAILSVVEWGICSCFPEFLDFHRDHQADCPGLKVRAMEAS